MVLTPSTMLPLGTRAPNFTLPDTVSGKHYSLEQLASQKATVVMFICNHCPFVLHILDKLIEVTKDYQAKGVRFIAISANDATTQPEDSPEKMKILAQSHQFPFPYLYDESQSVAKAYQAACTPDLYVFDHELACVYRGRFDDSTPGNKLPVTGADLIHALDSILAGDVVKNEQHPSVGCNIKWRNCAMQ